MKTFHFQSELAFDMIRRFPAVCVQYRYSPRAIEARCIGGGSWDGLYPGYRSGPPVLLREIQMVDNVVISSGYYWQGTLDLKVLHTHFTSSIVSLWQVKI